MENNNLSGEKKPEMITNKRGDYFILEGNMRSGKTKAMKEASERINKLTEAVRLSGITTIEMNNIMNINGRPINNIFEGNINISTEDFDSLKKLYKKQKASN